MFNFSNVIAAIRTLLKGREIEPEAFVEENWKADFSRASRARFLIEEGPAYRSVLERGHLALELKKGDCLAWSEDPLYRYTDIVAEADISFEEGAGYAASGLFFRYVDPSSYYAVLVSTRGYFRLDAVFNSSPLPLIAWTELPGRTEAPLTHFSLRVIAAVDRITVTINDQWVAEVVDRTLIEGRVAFALASYEKARRPAAHLTRFTLDSRPVEIEANNVRWNNLIRIPRENRLRLAETFMAMGQPLSTLVQLKRLWKASGDRSQRELLLAANAARALSLKEEADDYLDACINAAPDSEEAKEAVCERARLFYEGNRFEELRDQCEKALALFPGDITLFTLKGHALFNLGAWAKAAEAYDRAAELDRASGGSGGQGILDLNAGNAWERLGKKKEATARYLAAGNAFLAGEHYQDLDLLLPVLQKIAPKNYQVHALALKYAFALEDWGKVAASLAEAKRLAPEESSKDYDSTLPYLEALLLNRQGKRKEALPLLEKAVELEPEYVPYRLRLIEARYLISGDPFDKKLKALLDESLKLPGADGWLYNLAAQIALARGDIAEGRTWLERAAETIADELAVVLNRAELLYLSGKKQEALELLNDANDEGGQLHNARGNLLVRLGEYEEADRAYKDACRVATNPEFLRNRASCLIELGRFGEADEFLARALELEPSPRTLELTAYVAAKKGEYARAEAACRLGLELDPGDKGLLSSLSWAYLSLSRWESAAEAISRLEKAAKGDDAWMESAAELRKHLLDATTREVSCSDCGRSWRILKDPPEIGVLRLVAEPPDDLPAGTCPTCMKTWCIACGKKHMKAGRFICPSCDNPLKLIDNGLKKLLADWAAGH